MHTDQSMVTLRNKIHRIGDGVVIYVSSKGNASHSARIKVSNVLGTFSKTDNFTITIDMLQVIGTCKLSPHILERAKKWVALNKASLQELWKNPYADVEDFINLAPLE